MSEKQDLAAFRAEAGDAGMSEWDGLPPGEAATRDGWHWLRRKPGGMPEAWLWSDDGEGNYRWLEDGDGDPEGMARWFDYLGPCLLPAEVAAAVAAEREACAAVAVCEALDAFLDPRGLPVTSKNEWEQVSAAMETWRAARETKA